MAEHVILIAFSIRASTRHSAEDKLYDNLDLIRDLNNISYWTAEDERYDNSDNESAVFIPRTMSQVEANKLLRR